MLAAPRHDSFDWETSHELDQLRHEPGRRVVAKKP
jgi:hypothetical protein